MPKQISDERKTAYYLGLGLQVLGGLLFASTFVLIFMNFGDAGDFHAVHGFGDAPDFGGDDFGGGEFGGGGRHREFQEPGRSIAFTAFGGMALMIIGTIVRGVGARGLAGSGILLDPEQAREELEPYSRMAGGMIKDAIDEANLPLQREATNVIMVRCRACSGLNQESAKFCQECGQKL
jgi:hypothetical protein